MTVSVLIPWRAGCEHREQAWAHVAAAYREAHPEWELVEGASPDGPFSRTAAIVDAATRATGDVYVVVDSDVWCDDLDDAFEHLDAGWAIPHRLIHRLSAASTRRVLAGEPWRGQPLSTDNRQDAKPYVGHAAGTLLVLTAETFWSVPPDVRFVGWGQEDDAWACALRTLAGRPWRGRGDLVHLWHPAQPRRSRRVGNQANLDLYRRYRAAHRHPRMMRALVDETVFPPETRRR